MNPTMQFRAYVKHDHGTTPFLTSASSKQQVKEIIMKAEHCPECAIQKIEPLNLKEVMQEILRAQIKEAEICLEEYETINSFLTPFDGQPTKVLEKKLPPGMKLTADAYSIIIEVTATGNQHYIAYRSDPTIYHNRYDSYNSVNRVGSGYTINEASALLKKTSKLVKQAKLLSKLSDICDELNNVCIDLRREGSNLAYENITQLLSLPSDVIRDIMQS